MNPVEMTAHDILDQMKSGTLSADAVFQSHLDRINAVDKKLNAIVRLIDTSHEESSGKTAQIPVAVKDNICIREQEVTCASHILKGFRPPYDATVITRLKAAGCRLIAQANMDEFAFGSSTETSYYGKTRNPWGHNRVPGGSSGGSAAAVAAGEAVWAIGSDTGGSIRQPAAFCGVVGLKPTYGRVSRYGLIAFASSLDQIGPLTRDVEDSALLLQILAGHDPADSTCVDEAVPDYRKALERDVKGLKIGLPKEYFIEGVDPEVKQAIDDAIKIYKDLGAEFVEISLPHTPYAVATYYIVATAEASSNLARFDGVQYGLRAFPEKKRVSTLLDMYEETRGRGFGAEAKRRIMLGTYALSSGYYDAYYLKGLKVRTLIKQDFDRAFKEVDAILTPTSPTPAFEFGAKSSPLDMYLSDIFTLSANLSGIPGISIPCGLTKNRLPVGMQILARPFDEEMIFRVARAFEQKTGWHKEKPDLESIHE